MAGVLPPVRRRLARSGDHRGHQDEHLDGNTIGHQPRGEAAVRVGHDDEVAPVADRVDDRTGVVVQAGSIVITRQVRRYHIVATPAQLVFHQEQIRWRAFSSDPSLSSYGFHRSARSLGLESWKRP
jgi:hypothetical protein